MSTDGDAGERKHLHSARGNEISPAAIDVWMVVPQNVTIEIVEVTTRLIGRA